MQLRNKNLTSELLQCISAHLSSRKDCRKLEYIVYIGIVDDEHERQLTLGELDNIADKVFFYPKRYVYPDRFHRKKSDEIDIIAHVIKEHFPELYVCEDFNSVVVNSALLTPGKYQYILSFDEKKRQWIRVS